MAVKNMHSIIIWRDLTDFLYKWCYFLKRVWISTDFNNYFRTWFYFRMLNNRLTILSKRVPFHKFLVDLVYDCAPARRNRCLICQFYTIFLHRLNLPFRIDNWQRRIWIHLHHVPAKIIWCSENGFTLHYSVHN